VVTDANYLSQKATRPYYYTLDWDAALQSRRAGATLEYKLLRNAKMSGYSSDRIIDTHQALCSFESFLVLDDPTLAWFRTRVFRNPDFEVDHVGDFAPDRQLWLVKRLSQGADCAGGPTGAMTGAPGPISTAR